MTNIYVLGAGGIGTLVAAGLTKRFPVNFIVRTQSKIDLLKKTNNTFTITQLFNQNAKISRQIANASRAEEIKDRQIDFLIVSVKTFDTVKSLTPLLPKIGSSTHILLIQNGMGVLEELNAKVWPDASTRPVLYQGVITHGIFQDQSEIGTYNYSHAGNGDLKVARVDGKPATHPVIQALVESEINTSVYTFEDLLTHQVSKLMVNVCMNPTTSVLDCINYELADIDAVKEYFRCMIHEGMTILKRKYPALENRPELADDLLVDLACEKGFILNGKNSTSMRQDTLFLRDTEIDYINGYIVRLAEDMGLDAPYNRSIQLLTKSRSIINKRRAELKN
ncbi:hypothetical protein OGAPHI_002050 [Ogataea philodendri]|uniref:2-dehydropantoate 2-reductase n=1 Tax=Ogataea philodendri TaxID=1378263 RepID=A0A9P8T6Y4_9ASCO|nr:uncharacterized protein OGAPHI_002050 [Ogataea philodendri]KAH3668296.1 hypothetical protein OGAPHI_002050 [Ogataea philodendri]